ncbi:MAG: hypothetical protein ABJA81_00360 [Nocardioidaceae bacterium]
MCDLSVTLTVTDDNGLSDSATTQVVVTRRRGAFATTPVSHKLSTIPDPRRPLQWPTPGVVTLGLNVSGCTKTADDAAALCPHVAVGKSHLGKGFTIGTVQDPGGPFDGFAFISGTSLRLRREALLNPTIGPASPPPPGALVNWFDVNDGHGADIIGLVTALTQHEGMGAPGRPDSGHSGAFATAAATKAGNVNARLESLFDPDPSQLQQQADSTVDKAQKHLIDSAQDSKLSKIGWSGTVRVWDQAAGMWVTTTWSL